MGGMVVEHAQHDDFGLFVLCGDPLENFEAVLARQLNVEQHGFGIGIKLAVVKLSCAGEIGNGILAVARVPDDVEAAAVVQGSGQNECVILRVLDNHDLSHALRHTSHSTANPLRC